MEHFEEFIADVKLKYHTLVFWITSHIAFLKKTYYLLSLYYFVSLNIFFSLIIYWIEYNNPKITVGYMDALFLSVSASTCTGLITVDTQSLNQASQVLIVVIITMGSSVLLSSVPVIVRRYRMKEAWIKNQNPDDITKDSDWKALNLLLILIPTYVFCVYFFGFLLVRLSILTSSPGTDDLKDNDINSWWFSLFMTVSSFNNAGLSLRNNNLMSFLSSSFFLMVLCFLILIGNTAFPPMLRFILYWTKKWYNEDYEEAAQLVLATPRRYFTHMFNGLQTRWLLFMIFLINGFEFVIFCSLESDLDVFNDKQKDIFFAGLFQTISVRNAGFNVLDISTFTPAMQFVYVIMMYVAVYPIAISIRSTVIDDKTNDSTPEKLRYLMTRDMSVVLSAIFIISIIERDPLSNDSDQNFSMWKVIFEVVSAFGNVGLSLGTQDDPTVSFSSSLGDTGKFFIIVVMLLGKHRGLPHLSDLTIFFTRESLTLTYSERSETYEASIEEL